MSQLYRHLHSIWVSFAIYRNIRAQLYRLPVTFKPIDSHMCTYRWKLQHSFMPQYG